LKHDRFVDEIGSLGGKARENQRLILTAAVAVAIVAVAVYGIFAWRSNHEQKGQDALSAAITTADSPLLPAKPGSEPVPGARYKTDAERNAAAEKQFKDVAANYSGTDAADIAGLYLARFDASKGDTSTAKQLLQKFISDHPKHVLVGSACFSLYQLRIENGEAAQVASELQAEIAKPSPVLPPDTLLVLLAHAYDAQNNGVKAKEAYKRITTEYPDSPYALEAQRRGGPA